MTVSETFIREILSLYVFGGIVTAIFLPKVVRYFHPEE